MVPKFTLWLWTMNFFFNLLESFSPPGGNGFTAERQANPVLDQPKPTTERPTVDYYRLNVCNPQPEAY